MNLARILAVALAVLLTPMVANAHLIRFDVTGVTGLTGSESVLLPYGTPWSAYVVYDSDTPPLYGSCEVTGEGIEYCNYNAVVEARFFLGPLEGEWEGPDPDEELTDFLNGSPSIEQHFDNIRWMLESAVSDSLENGEPDYIEGVHILGLTLDFQDTMATALNSVELPSSWELNDFDNVSGVMGLTNHESVHLTIDTLSFSRVPEPGTLALFGLGLFGMGLARRKRQTA